MTEPIELRLLHESRLEPRLHGGIVTYNPTIELFAGAAGPTTLQIWRANNQVVTKNSQRGDRASVQAVRWKSDGQFLAVGWSDGIVRLMGLETNKAVHQITIPEAAKSRITCISWAQNLATKRPGAAIETSIRTWEQLASQGLDLTKKKPAADLPRELTFLEIETALPKLSPLPAGGSGDDTFVFTTRASLEFLFRPFSKDDSDKVDVMVVGTDDGQIHISIYDSFVIGSFRYSLPPSFGRKTELKLCGSASHLELSTHMLVFSPSTEDKTKTLYLVPIDLTFINSSPENLSLLASKTTTLQKLLRYVKQVQTHMLKEWQSTRELPNRFLNSINQTLKESEAYGDMNIGQAMYHSVVTGHTFPEVKEWLVDQLAERGHKRWDKAVVTGLQALRSLVHENFLPALERVSVILSRLLGIARFHESKAEIGFTSAQIMKVMDIVSCLMLVGNKILLLVMEELELFHAFSIWLRHEIDRLASSSTTDDLTEKDATMEHGKILAYIQQYMPASPLRHYLSDIEAEDVGRDRKLADSGSSLLELLTKQIQKQESTQADAGSYSQIEFLCKYLDSQAAGVLEGIAEAERRSVRFGQATKIVLDGNVSRFDVRLSATPVGDAWRGVTHTALITEGNDSQVYIFRTSTTITNGISSSVVAELSRMTLGDGKIVDLKFLYDDSLLVLWAPKDSPLRLIRIPHKSEDLGYQPYTAGTQIASHELSNEQVTSVFLNMIVPCPPGFVPAQMEIKEASAERGTLPPRLCLLGTDMQTYIVFALPEDPFGEALGSRR
ncbi:anaphase-promoting complex, cyclosome, subunit 4-domain-containing protein [Xylaria bambusicola]|uniref:anaphase-promoting complex, cyclosome, subunit 4-domain-containing protein n=1 Tax=Xylaria bambusicola TaxID=326684 RepID=UPI002007C0DE|nr:anaphase-promoting complex, cyclosome, subunit 4-domain-containing protein [Xylaria bambusicola]KAI0527821.1 anaphase-promoting complex, cyclosome, subunit 4-domain-containing protein [Xylaria bambusicola]